MSQRRILGPARTVGMVLVGVALVAGAAACGGDDDDAAEPAPGDGTSPAETASTSNAQPPGSEPDDVEPYITELLTRYDEVTNQIVADPSVANDRANPLIDEYLSLVEADSDAAGAVQTWVDNAAEGTSIRPYSDDAPPFETSLDGAVETVSEDEVTFPTCEAQNYRAYDAQGRETEFVTEQSVPGEGTAVRVDGEWRLRRLDLAANELGCRRSET